MAKSKKTRPKRVTNITGELLKEIQATIAFACYDTPSVIRRGTSLAEAAIENKMSLLYYGDDTHEAPDPDLIVFEDQLILGLKKFKGLFTQSVQDGPNGESGEVLLSIPEILHRHKNLLVYVGDGSIEKNLLSQKSVHVTDKRIIGRTLDTMAKNVCKNCKKMMAIVTRKGSPYKDGRFPSGSNWDDYILWCLIEMGKEYDREEAARIDTELKKVAGAEKATANAGGIVSIANVQTSVVSSNKDTNAGNSSSRSNANAAGSASNDLDSAGSLVIESSGGGGGDEQQGGGTSDLLGADDEEDKYPNKKFFKCGPGFIAWALWGHIPILDSAGMQGDFFGDAKKKASFGRNTESRAAFRRLLVEKNGAGVDNRRGKKRRVLEEEEASTLTPTPSDSSKILAKTLEYMAAESLENKRQKLAEMGMRNIRDKLISRRRKEDSIYKEIDRLCRGKKKPGQALLDEKAVTEKEIVELEEKLDEMQSEECRRHSDIINQRSLELTASTSSEDTGDTTITTRTDTIVRTNSNNESDSVDNRPVIEVVDDDDNDDDDDDDINVNILVARANTAKTNGNNGGCIECNLPSNHSCRNCKMCVCSLCCGEKRELENAWWCGLCFTAQTVANQTVDSRWALFF